jgi:hypothetical protein
LLHKNKKVAGLLIFLLIILAIFGYLLFAPFYIEINSINSLYGVRFHRIASAKLIFADNLLKIDLHIIGWKKQIDPFEKRAKRKEKTVVQKKKKQRTLFSISRAKALIKSFKINKFYLNIDTGNLQLNGILYPCFYWLGNYAGKPIAINFLNKNEIILEIENNLAGIIRAFIYSSLKTKNHGKFQ